MAVSKLVQTIRRILASKYWILLLVLVFLLLRVGLEFAPPVIVALVGIPCAIYLLSARMRHWTRDSHATRHLLLEYPVLRVARSSGPAREIDLQDVRTASVVDSSEGHVGMKLSYGTGDCATYHLPVEREQLISVVEQINEAAKRHV